MKTIKKIRFLLTAALSAVMFASMIGALTVNRKNAFAEETYSITAEQGAQLRLSSEGGLRFRFTLDRATRDYVIQNEDVKIQFIIAPKSYFDANVAEANGLKTFVDDEENKIYPSTTDGVYYVNGCIQNVNVKNVALDFMCQARVVKTGDDGAVTEVIASAASDARNLYDVVNDTLLLADYSFEADILDGEKTPYSAWFGTENYPVQIDTEEEYTVLKTKCAADGSALFNNVAVAVDGGVTASESDFPETNKPSVDKMYTVTFMNGSDVYATVKVKNGKAAAEPAINPRKASDNAFAYTFSGWDGDYSSVTEDVTVTAKYTSALIFDDEAALSEIAEWETAGATKIASALKSDESVYTFGTNNVYTLYDSGYESIANTEIVASNYQTLYLAFMTTKAASLAHGTDNKNEANTWYFVKYEKQDDGSWTLSAKKFGGEDYTELTNGDAKFLTGSFTDMFKTYSWDSDYDVYATDVWAKTPEEYESVEKTINALPETASTVDEIDNVFAAESAYNALPAEQKAKVSAESVQKLNTLLASIFANEISSFKGATKAADSAIGNDTYSATLDSTYGDYDVYKMSVTGGGARNIGTKHVADINAYDTLYYCLKMTEAHTIVDGTNTPSLGANKWYSIKFVKGDANWTIWKKAFGETDYEEIKLQNYQTVKSTGTMPADAALRIVDWNSTTYDVYATGLWSKVTEEYESVEKTINALPETASTVDEINNVFAAESAYNALPAEQKEKVSAESVQKLNALLGSIFANEISSYEAAGATKTQNSALKSASVKSGTVGSCDIYTLSGLTGWNNAIGVGININNSESNFSTLYFAFKVTASVTIFDGSNTPALSANKWYSIKLVKGEANWTVWAKAFGEEDYEEIVLGNYSDLSVSGDKWFSTAFKAVDLSGKVSSYDVYATGLWAE